MRIDPQRVEELYVGCLAEDLPDDDPRDLIVEGIMAPTAFDTEKLEARRAEVVEMLSWLPMNFRDDTTSGGGGGWSFLNACEDREGTLWGSHQGMDQLFQLSIGLGVARYLMPREFWSALPGGMPYLSVTVPSS